MTRGSPDREVVRRHVSALRDALANLRRHSSATASEMRVDADLRWAVERGLQLCAQNTLDIATHIAAAAGVDAPDYTTAIDRLPEVSAVPAELAARLRPIAGFRNVLVHGYLQTDLSIVERVLREKLDEFDEFADAIDRMFDEPANR